MDESWKHVYDALMDTPIINGTYDAKNGNQAFMSGVGLVMERIAYESGMEEDFNDRFFGNIEASERKAGIFY